MVSLVVPGAAQVRLVWGLATNTMVQINVLGATKPGNVTVNQTLANALGAAIKAAVATSGLAPVLSTATTLNTVGIRDITAANNAEFLDAGAAVAGTSAGDLLPRATSLVVTLRTARAGSSFRGRVYLGGFTETNNGPGGNPDATLQTACVNFVNAIRTALQGQGMDLGVVSRPANQVTITRDELLPNGQHNIDTKVQKARPGQVTAVTVVQMRNAIWDSQRRRTTTGSASTLMAPLYSLEPGQVASVA